MAFQRFSTNGSGTLWAKIWSPWSDPSYTGILPHFLNHTDITLIPKIVNPIRHSDFRPINLCNFNYKTISKVLANRLKPYLSELITPFQSAFVAGRLLKDNIMITHEVFHSLQANKSTKIMVCVMKLYMQKAYERVKWGFLMRVMERMGFNNTWS